MAVFNCTTIIVIISLCQSLSRSASIRLLKTCKNVSFIWKEDQHSRRLGGSVAAWTYFATQSKSAGIRMPKRACQLRAYWNVSRPWIVSIRQRRRSAQVKLQKYRLFYLHHRTWLRTTATRRSTVRVRWPTLNRACSDLDRNSAY